MKPAVAGMPDNDSMKISMANADPGARRASPAKSATRSPATCSCRSAITRANAPMLTKV